MQQRRPARFLLVIAASLLLGAVLAAGQSVVFDPDGSPVATFTGILQVDGDLGIGTGSPEQDLHIADTPARIIIDNDPDDTNDNIDPYIYWHDDGSGKLAYGLDDSKNDDFTLVNMSDSGWTEMLHIYRATGDVEVAAGDLQVTGGGDVQAANLDGAPAINWDFEAGPVGDNKRIPGWETSAWYLDHDSSVGTTSGSYAYGEETCCDHDDSGSGGGVGQYDLYKRFSGDFGNEQLSVSVDAEILSDLDGVGTCSAGNAYVGEDDARIFLNAYDADGALIGTKKGNWGAWHAVQEGYSGDGNENSRDIHDYVKLWANWTAPAGTKMIEVDLVAGEATDSCIDFDSKGGGNSAVYFDDFEFETDAEGWRDLGGQTQYRVADTLDVDTIAQPGWTTPSLQNGWVNYGGSWAPVGYYKDAEGIVHVRGLIKSGSIGSVAFTLPSGYRPANDKHFPAPTNTGSDDVCIVRAYSDGTVNIGSACDNSWVSLESIDFRAQ